MNKSLSIIRIWLYIGLFMVFVQVIIGGITRLTDSGLSITEWELVRGVIPPLNDAEWKVAFDKYQQHANRQFEVLHADMTLASFKWIYFWEWIHRMWARSMGFVFLIPLIFFIFKRWITKPLGWKLLIMFGLAALEGLFGWIMVASGLNDDTRTWVSAYKLIIHLGIATVLFGYIYWTILSLRTSLGLNHKPLVLGVKSTYVWIQFILMLFFTQIIMGGLMAGMHAAILYPYYPIVVHLDQFSHGLSQSIAWTDVIDYEPSIVIKTWIQLIHRGLALVILISILWITFKIKRSDQDIRYILYALSGVLVQYILGVITILLSVGTVPVFWGVLHQGTALVVFLLLIHAWYRYKWRTRI